LKQVLDTSDDRRTSCVVAVADVGNIVPAYDANICGDDTDTGWEIAADGDDEVYATQRVDSDWLRLAGVLGEAVGNQARNDVTRDFRVRYQTERARVDVRVFSATKPARVGSRDDALGRAVKANERDLQWFAQGTLEIGAMIQLPY